MILEFNGCKFYESFPKQSDFHRSRHEFRLFGGAAGPGKTVALLMEAVDQAHRFPGVDTLLLRRTFPELEESLLLEFRRSVPRELYRDFNEAKHVVTWRNGSTTRFGYCKSEKDVYQYQGGSFLFIGFDELTHFTLKQWEYLTTRNRCTAPGSFPCMAGATNPGNIGHAWVKALWIDKKAAPGMERAEEYDSNAYGFTQAYLDDNPLYAANTQAGRNYRAKLERLPRHLRDALLLGKWDVFAGQYFDCFDVATMVANPAEWEIKPWWTRWISVDWGYKHPACVHWHCLTDDGKPRTYNEFVRSRLDPAALGRAIAERTPAEERKRITRIYLGPDAWAERTSARTVAEQMGDELAAAGMPRPTQADDDRVGGWRLMYQLLRDGSWEIGANCAALVRALPGLIHDEKKPEDCAKVDDPLSDSGQVITAENCSGDDPADSARYGMKSWEWPARKPMEARVADRLQENVQQVYGVKKLEDVTPENYTAVMLRRAAILEQERKSETPARLIGRRRRH